MSEKAEERKCADCYWNDICSDSGARDGKACVYFLEIESDGVTIEELREYRRTLKERQEIYDGVIEELNDQRIQDRKEKYGK